MNISLGGRKDVTLTVIARRSRHFAGTRYAKRGLKEGEGAYVANEVESELMIASGYPWNDGTPGIKVSCLTFMRGSIPLFWTQLNPLSPRPEIISKIIYSFRIVLT